MLHSTFGHTLKRKQTRNRRERSKRKRLQKSLQARETSQLSPFSLAEFVGHSDRSSDRFTLTPRVQEYKRISYVGSSALAYTSSFFFLLTPATVLGWR